MLSCFFLFRECEQPGSSLLRLEEADISLGKRPGEADIVLGKRPGEADIVLGKRPGEAELGLGKRPAEAEFGLGKILGGARMESRPSLSHLTYGQIANF
jgi:hypothetical protein